MLTNKNEEKTNVNEPNQYYPSIRFMWLDEESRTDILELLFEVKEDYSCDIPREKIVGNLCFLDLRNVIECCKNPWEAPLAFARCFVDAGVRVFPDPNGIIIATMVENQEDFKNLIQGPMGRAFGILQENNNDLLQEEVSCVLFG